MACASTCMTAYAVHPAQQQETMPLMTTSRTTRSYYCTSLVLEGIIACQHVWSRLQSPTFNTSHHGSSMCHHEKTVCWRGAFIKCVNAQVSTSFGRSMWHACLPAQPQPGGASKLDLSIFNPARSQNSQANHPRRQLALQTAMQVCVQAVSLAAAAAARQPPQRLAALACPRK